MCFLHNDYKDYLINRKQQDSFSSGIFFMPVYPKDLFATVLFLLFINDIADTFFTC